MGQLACCLPYRAVNAAGEASGWLLEYPFATALATDP